MWTAERRLNWASWREGGFGVFNCLFLHQHAFPRRSFSSTFITLPHPHRSSPCSVAASSPPQPSSPPVTLNHLGSPSPTPVPPLGGVRPEISSLRSIFSLSFPFFSISLGLCQHTCLDLRHVAILNIYRCVSLVLPVVCECQTD